MANLLLLGEQIKNQIPLQICSALFMDERTADIRFSIKTANGERKIPAHKNILARASEYFDRLFYGDCHDMTTNYNARFAEVVDVPGVGILQTPTETEFEEFLKFFYLPGHVPTFTNIKKIMELANYCVVIECLNICEEFLQQNCTYDTVCMAYELAIEYELNELKAFCAEVISKHTIVVFGTDGFRQCSEKVLKNILGIDAFSCDAKLLFDVCIDWAKNKCEESGIDAANMENVRDQLINCLYLLPFKLMTPEQFSEITVKYFKLLTYEEMVEINALISDVPVDFNLFKRDPYKNNKCNVLCSQLSEIFEKRLLSMNEKVTIRTNQTMQLDEIGIFLFYFERENMGFRSQGYQSQNFSKIISCTLTIGSKCANRADNKILLEQTIDIKQHAYSVANPPNGHSQFVEKRFKLTKPIMFIRNEVFELQLHFKYQDGLNLDRIYTYADCKSKVQFYKDLVAHFEITNKFPLNWYFNL